MPVVVAVLLVAVIGAVAALRLEPDAGTDQLVDDDSAAFRATEDFKQRFGDDAVVVLVRGDLEQLVLTSDLGTLLSLEGCLSGNVEGGKVFTDAPAPAPCAELADETARAGGARRRHLPQPVGDPGDGGAPGADRGRPARGATSPPPRRRARPATRGSATSRSRPPPRPPPPR